MTIKIKKNKGFVILFAVTLAAIFLSIALGVADITLREVNFGTSIKDTSSAFYAADIGTEHALFNDKNPITYPNPVVTQTWTFGDTGLGSTNKSCANVKIEKDTNALFTLVTITSDGYNNNSSVVSGTCTPASNAVARELITTYQD